MEKVNLYGYARVSTQKQNLDRQLEALKEYGILKENIFVDKKTGKDFNREEYQLLKQILKRTKNNVLVIKSIDRLGRNYKEIQKEWQEITTDLGAINEVIRQTTITKTAIGFGINNPIQAKEIAKHADGVIVGSAIIKLIEKSGDNYLDAVYNYVKEMKEAINS